MAVGGYYSPSHKNAEVLNTQRNTWSSINPYPYDLGFYIWKAFFISLFSSFIPIKASSHIYQAPIVFIDDAFYVIGGYGATNQKVIGKLDATSMVWSQAGELVTGRYAHNAIFDGTNILVVGGNASNIKIEKCTFSNGQISCSVQNPALSYYAYYPELFLVPTNFCKNWP